MNRTLFYPAVYTAMGLYGFGVYYDTWVAPDGQGDHLAPPAIAFSTSSGVSISVSFPVTFVSNPTTGDEVAVPRLRPLAARVSGGVG